PPRDCDRLHPRQKIPAPPAWAPTQHLDSFGAERTPPPCRLQQPGNEGTSGWSVEAQLARSHGRTSGATDRVGPSFSRLASAPPRPSELTRRCPQSQLPRVKCA